MGYDINGYFGQKIHRNQWASEILDKSFFIIFGRSYYREAPISYSDCLLISKKLNNLIKKYNENPEYINSIQIKSISISQEQFINSIKLDKNAIEYIRKVSRFFKFSKGIITEEEYDKLFYPIICECSEILKFKISRQNHLKVICKTCNKQYSLISAISIIMKKPFSIIKMIFRFLFGFVLKSQISFKEMKQGYL